MPKQPKPRPRRLRLSCNTILDGRFINAGDRLPVERGADLPEVLRPLVVTGEPEPEEPNEAGGFFDLNTPYRVTDDNRLGRRVQRQISEMEAAAQEQEWIEEQMDAPLPPRIAETLQQAHQSHVGLQAAQAAALARAADAVADAAAAASAPRPLYVKRGSRHYVEIHRTKLRPAEPVFVKDADGAYESIGITDSRCEPPEPPSNPMNFRLEKSTTASAA